MFFIKNYNYSTFSNEETNLPIRYKTTQPPAGIIWKEKISQILGVINMFGALFLTVSAALGHGAQVNPRTRNSVDYISGVNTQRCSNLTGAACNNGKRILNF